MNTEHDGNRLSRLMERAGISPAALADAAGVSEAGVSKWVNKGQIARKHIPTICAQLRCSADELLGIRQTPPAKAARLRDDLLVDAIEVIEAGLEQARVKLPAAKRARLVIAVYELAEERGQRVESATILRLIRLAS